MRYGKIIFEGFNANNVPKNEHYLGVRDGVGFSINIEPDNQGNEEFTLYLPNNQ